MQEPPEREGNGRKAISTILLEGRVFFTGLGRDRQDKAMRIRE